MEKNLLPCPFCNGAAELIPLSFSEGGLTHFQLRIECSTQTCGAQMNSGYRLYAEKFENVDQKKKQEAFNLLQERWNLRK